MPDLLTIPEFNAKANLNSPAFTGTPTAPTPALADDSQKLATTAFVKDAVEAGILGDGVRADIEVDNSGADWLIVEPQVAAVKTAYKHLSSYASHASLVAEAAANLSTKYIVTVDETPTIAAGISHPRNLFLDFSKTYGLSVNSGQVVNINRPLNAPEHRIFHGAGQVRIQETAGFTDLHAIWYLDDGTASAATISSAQSEAMRYGLFNNNGGAIIFPVGEYEIDHYFLLQRGGVIGSSHDPNIQGTIIRRTGSLAGGEGQASIFRFLAGGRSMFIKNMVLEQNIAAGTSMLARGTSGDQTIESIVVEYVTANGGSEGFTITDTHSNKNWQVHNVHIARTCHFIGQTVACIRCNTINGGGEVYANLRPDGNGTSVGVKLESAAKWILAANGEGVLAETLPGAPTAGIRFTFTSGDVDTTNNKVIKASTGAVNGDKVYFSNSGGALPGGLLAATPYWVERIGNDHYFYDNPWSATHNDTASRKDISTAGTGTQTYWSSRPNPVATPDQPAALYEISGGYTEGITITGNARDEGFPLFLHVKSTTPTNHATPICMRGVMSQGQIQLDASVDLDVTGGWLLADGIKDSDGVSARVRLRGVGIYTFGVGGAQNNYGGYAVPAPARHDDFIGSSALEYYENSPDGDIHGRNANDVPLGGWQVFNNATSRALWMKVKRLGSGLKAGWFALYNSMDGFLDAQSGLDVQGGLSVKGRLLNARVDAAANGSGTITMDLRLGNVFTVTPDEASTIEFSNGNTGHSQDVKLVILTSGATSYNLTAGTNVVMQAGAFATGTVTGALYVLEFHWNGTFLIEKGRVPGAGGGGGSVASDAIWDAKGDLAAGTAANSAAKLVVGANDTFLIADSAQSTGLKWGTEIPILNIVGTSSEIKIKDRATSATYMHIYSAVSGRLNIYGDIAGGDIMTLDQNEVIINRYPKVDSTLNDAYNASSWNGSLKLVTQDAVRDKVETMFDGSGASGRLGIWSSASALSGDADLTYGDAQLNVVIPTDTAANAAFRFRFRGYDGSAYTKGLLIETTDAGAYYPEYFIKCYSAGYGVDGLISTSNTPGLFFGSSGARPHFTFAGASSGTHGTVAAGTKIEVKTGSYTCAISETRVLFTNEGTTARVDLTLPPADAGLSYKFYCHDTDGIRVIAGTGDTIRIGASVSATAGRIDSVTVGSSILLTCINATEWVAEFSSGTWTVT